MPDLLPDCRTKAGTSARPGPGGMWVPLYCGHCHKECGLVPVDNMTFAFYLCTDCFKQMGEITNTMVMPDEVYWAKLKEAQLEEFGRPLAEPELIQVVEADASPLATLVNERR